MRRCWALVFVFFSAICPAQTKTPAEISSPTVPLELRVFVASKIYASAQEYFAHWRSVPDIDLDAAYRQYLEAALKSDDRYQFDLATMAFMAKLHNGHSNFDDAWLTREYGAPLGFRARRSQGRWVITESAAEGLNRGDVIYQLNGTAFSDFFANVKQYLHGSSAAHNEHLLFDAPYLWPKQFELMLADGRRVKIARGQGLKPETPHKSNGRWIEAQKLAYIAIPSFNTSDDETTALDLLQQFAAAKALIIDVRGNSGGITPQRLLRALLNKPYRTWVAGSPNNVPVWLAYRSIYQKYGDRLDPEDRGSLSSFAELATAELRWGGEAVTPEKDAYPGRVILLIDGECASACEDFVMPFKDSRRAQLVGEATEGSSGQPFLYSFGNGMAFRVGSKVQYFPDGRTFEGVGVQPDIEIAPAADDIRAHRDPALQKAIEIAQE